MCVYILYVYNNNIEDVVCVIIIHIYIYDVYLNTRPEISLFSLHPVTVFIISWCTANPHPLPTTATAARLLSTIFTLICTWCKTFIISFLFFFRNLSHCRHRYRAIGRRRPRLCTDPSHAARAGRARGPRGSATRVRPSSPLVDVE